MTTDQQRLRCEFQLLRYVPDPVRNEFVHVGVLLREQQEAQSAVPAMELRFTRDWRRVRCLDPYVDTAMLEGMETELRQRLGHDPDGKMKRILDEALSLNVQMTTPKAYLAESLPAGIEELMRMYVDPPRRERVPRLSGRAAIQSVMRDEFEHAGVWDVLRKRIPASDYTRQGDPLRLDAGYRPNGVIRMFHAVSLEPGLDLAKVLAFSAAGLRTGVERVEKASLELTAIIEPASKLGANDDDPDRLAMYRFGVETMEENQIRVLTTADMSRVAETARRELRV
jgi:hypothetical protein